MTEELTRQDVVDIGLFKNDDGILDREIGPDGDWVPVYGFETATILSLFTDRRATESEIFDAMKRRGWIGSETAVVPGFEYGSKLWLKYQARNNTDTKNSVVAAAKQALEWLVTDGYLKDIQVSGVLQSEGILLEIVFVRKNGKVDKLYFKLWERTGAIEI